MVSTLHVEVDVLEIGADEDVVEELKFIIPEGEVFEEMAELDDFFGWGFLIYKEIYVMDQEVVEHEVVLCEGTVEGSFGQFPWDECLLEDVVDGGDDVAGFIVS